MQSQESLQSSPIPNILIVEDEGSIATGLADSLEKMNYRVAGICATQQETLSYLKLLKPDLVILDIQLRNHEESLQIAEILHHHYRIPTIFLIGNATEMTVPRAMLTEPYGHVLKPYQARELYTAIEIALSRYRTESILQKNKQPLEAALRSISEGVMTTDARGYITFINPAAQILTGCHESEALGHYLDEVMTLIDPHTNQPVGNPVYEAMKGSLKSSLEQEVALIARDGICHIVESRTSLLQDGSGAVIVFRDVTGQRQIQKAFDQANQKMKEAAQLKSDFASMVSHDIRTPLGVLNEGLKLVLDGLDGPINPQQRDTLTIVHNSVHRLERLINNILDFSKLEAGRMPWHFDKKDVRLLIEDAYQTMQPIAEKKAILLTKNLPPDPLVTLCDGEKIKVVILNLLDNAIKYNIAGGSVTIAASLEGNDIKIVVTDTGQGIQASDLPSLFERFSQAGGQELRLSGRSGLGLHLSQKIMQKHEGTIQVKTEEGKGSEFTITLPVGKNNIDTATSLSLKQK